MTTDGHVMTATDVALLRQEVELLRASLQQSSLEAELLRAERQQYLEQLQQKSREIDGLQHQLQQLLRRLFGRSAEKIDPKQMLLFETLLNQLAPPTPTVEAAPESAPAPKPSTNGHGRRRLPADLPRKKVIHDLPEDQKPCPCCRTMRHVIGQEVSEQLDYVPAKLTVIEHVRLKYACRACEENAAESGPQIITADKPSSPIEKGLAAPGLLSYVIVSKYGDHLPLHRLEHILARHGIQIARSTTCDWAAQCAALLRPLYHRMMGEVLQSKVIHTDDTPVDILDRERTKTRIGVHCCLRRHAPQPIVLPSRASPVRRTVRLHQLDPPPDQIVHLPSGNVISLRPPKGRETHPDTFSFPPQIDRPERLRKIILTPLPHLFRLVGVEVGEAAAGAGVEVGAAVDG